VYLHPTGDDRTLQYDPTASFAANLDRLARFCAIHKDDADLAACVDPFVATARDRSGTEFAAIQPAFATNTELPVYRVVLLACLMSAEAPAETKAALVWGIATNADELVSVRRTAAFLTGQLDSTVSRPDAYRVLLADKDDQVALFALTSANRNINLDAANYELVKTRFLASENIHLRVAAVTVIGTAPYPDSQAVLLNLVKSTATTDITPLSEGTLAKRSALALLDARDPPTRQLLTSIALEEAEDPSIRAKAIGRIATVVSPETDKVLTGLLSTTPEDNLIVLRAVVDALAVRSPAADLGFVKQRITQLTDPQIRKVLSHRLEIASRERSP
jgi:hypothetical protein